MAYAMVTGTQGTNDLDGKFSYTITKDDLKGSNVDDFTMSVGIVNALDNAVTSTLKLKNLEYTSSGVTDAAGYRD